jgi:hypothetical protein
MTTIILSYPPVTLRTTTTIPIATLSAPKCSLRILIALPPLSTDIRSYCNTPTGEEVRVTVARKNGCDRKLQDYNIPLRIGAMFAVLFTSAIGQSDYQLRWPQNRNKSDEKNRCLQSHLPVLDVGVQILDHTHRHQAIRNWSRHLHGFRPCTHVPSIAPSREANEEQLYTHASIGFANPCLAQLGYEATSSAITMAGLFLSFLVEFLAHRRVHQQEHDKKDGPRLYKISPQIASILVLEAGIVFHSVCRCKHLSKT